MSRLSSSIRETVSALGPGNALLYAAARLADRATRGRCRLVKYHFVAQPVPEAAPESSRPSKTRIYLATPGDGIIAQSPRPADVIAKRFADGARCFVAEQAGTFVGFLWIKEGSYDEDEVRCCYRLHPPDRLAWDFDIYVAPDFRMSRAFAQLWDAATAYLREHGYLWTISRISAFNAASLASHARLGTVRLQTGTFVVAGGMQLAMFSRRPFLHIGFGADDAPTLDFRAPPS